MQRPLRLMGSGFEGLLKGLRGPPEAFFILLQNQVGKCSGFMCPATSALAGITLDLPQAPAVTAPPPAPVPAITKAQCLLWLLQQGKTEADVDAAIAAITDSEARSVAEIEWKYRQPFHSDHPLFAQLAPALGIDVSALPDAFRAAAQL